MVLLAVTVAPELRRHIGEGRGGHQFPRYALAHRDTLDAFPSFDSGIVDLHWHAQATPGTSTHIYRYQWVTDAEAPGNVSAARDVVQADMGWETLVVEPLKQCVAENHACTSDRPERTQIEHFTRLEPRSLQFV